MLVTAGTLCTPWGAELPKYDNPPVEGKAELSRLAQKAPQPCQMTLFCWCLLDPVIRTDEMDKTAPRGWVNISSYCAVILYHLAWNYLRDLSLVWHNLAIGTVISIISLFSNPFSWILHIEPPSEQWAVPQYKSTVILVQVSLCLTVSVFMVPDLLEKIECISECLSSFFSLKLVTQ